MSLQLQETKDERADQESGRQGEDHVSASKLKDPGRLFYKPAVRDTVERGDIAQAKTLLKAAEDIQASGGLKPLIADLKSAIARGG